MIYNGKLINMTEYIRNTLVFLLFIGPAYHKLIYILLSSFRLLYLKKQKQEGTAYTHMFLFNHSLSSENNTIIWLEKKSCNFL